MKSCCYARRRLSDCCMKVWPRTTHFLASLLIPPSQKIAPALFHHQSCWAVLHSHCSNEEYDWYYVASQRHRVMPCCSLSTASFFLLISVVCCVASLYYVMPCPKAAHSAFCSPAFPLLWLWEQVYSIGVTPSPFALCQGLSCKVMVIFRVF